MTTIKGQGGLLRTWVFVIYSLQKLIQWLGTDEEEERKEEELTELQENTEIIVPKEFVNENEENMKFVWAII